LEHAENLMNALLSANTVGAEGAPAVIEAISRKPGWPMLFAMDMDGKTRVFRANDDVANEDDAREQMPWYEGPIVTFHFDVDDGAVVVRNHLLSAMYDDKTGKRMADDIQDIVSRESGSPATMTFDPCLCRPYYTKMSCVPALWHSILDEAGEEARDLPILEVPGNVPGGWTLIRDPKEEKKVPSIEKVKGDARTSLEYPFVAIDNRLNRGAKMRALSKAYAKATGTPLEKNETGVELSMRLKDRSERANLLRRISRLLELGLSPRDVLDFYSDYSSLPRRVAYRDVILEAAEMSSPGRTVTASVPIGVNDWWWPSAQEGLKMKGHSEKEEDEKEPLNKPEKEEPMVEPTIEVLLARDRDPLQSQKPTELLLRESQL
jgi:hypothetical protein